MDMGGCPVKLHIAMKALRSSNSSKHRRVFSSGESKVLKIGLFLRNKREKHVCLAL